MSSRNQIYFWAALCILTLFSPLIASAQTSGQSNIRIHETSDPQQVTTAAGYIGLSLQTAFSLLDAEDQVMMDFEIENATFELGDDTYPAVIQELETPWTVVLLIDTSITMGGYAASSTFKAVKNAIASVVGGIPQNSNIAVISFDDGAPTKLEFTQKKDSVTASITGLRAKSSGNSCLNNGLYEAVNKLSGAPGRRAVIVFTASADDCATRTAQEVVDLAHANRVQIYPIGLQGYTITREELDALADPAGGLAEFRDEGTLGFGLSNLTALLVNQWTAKATIYPPSGENTATLTVNLSDDTTLTSPPISFISPQDYIPPTEIQLKGKVQSLAEGILFNLDVIHPEKIRELNVSIVSKDTGQTVLSQTLVSFSNVNTVPTVSLFPGLEYTLTVTAFDDAGQALSEGSADFKYEPPQARLIVTDAQTPSEDQEAFLITVSAQNLGAAVKYKAWLTDVNSGAPISGTETTVPLGDLILIPSDGLDTGDYAVVVQALDSTDTVLAVSPPVKIAYKRQNLFESFRKWVSDSPLAIAGLTGLCCLVPVCIAGLIFFILPKRSARSATVDLVMPQKERRIAPRAQRASQKPQQQALKQRTPSKPPPPPEMEVPISPPKVSAPVIPKPQRRDEVMQLPAARIILLGLALEEFSAELIHTPFTIGRQKDNDAALPVDSSSGVSKQHLTITFEDGQYFALDDNSTFGTTLNDVILTKGQPAPLQDGTIIGLGPMVKIKFQLASKADSD